MGMGRTLLTKAATGLDLPEDIAAGLPRVEMTGFSKCSLDCHNGILEYEPNQIVVAVNIGTVTIQGNGLEVRLMHRDRLTITGNIYGILFSGGGG